MSILSFPIFASDSASILVRQKHCFTPNIREIRISDKSSLKYRYTPPLDKSYPTVIYFAGGPGGSGIRKNLINIPEEFGRLRVDIRGVGCNRNLHKDDLNYSSEIFAQDYIHIIKKEKIKKHIFYGVSYGTILATITASKIADDRLISSPTSVVLEGVHGKALKKGIIAGNEKLLHAQRVIKRLDYNFFEFLVSNNFFNIKKKAWANFIESVLPYGYINKTETEYLEYFLNLLNSNKYEQREPLLRLIKKKEEELKSNYNNELHREISCNETARSMPGLKYDLEIVDSTLRLKNKNICQSFTEMSHPFDSSLWQIDSPIYYFSGTKDSSTPITGAIYHYDNQKRTQEKYFFKVIGGGHNPLSFNQGEECSFLFWRSLNGSLKNFTDNIKQKCQLPIVFSR